MARVVLSPVSFWEHDLCNCLHTCIATVLLKHGQDPTLALGASWDFFYQPGDVRREEFYHPTRSDDLARTLAPYHPVSSVWNHPPDGDPGHEGIMDAMRREVLPIVAVDNYYLPFRPAYGDVHAAHTVVAYGFDEDAGELYVIDSIPPAFNGAVRSVDLAASRCSANPSEGTDAFFASSPISARWLEFVVTGPFPPVTRDWVIDVIESNLTRFAAHPEEAALSGLDGLGRYLAGVPERAAGSEGGAALEEAYVLGWAIQAGTALHADFLASVGRRLGSPGLAEAGRLVERVAHDWTVVRMTAAHGRERPEEAGDQLERRGKALVRHQEQALEGLEWALRHPRERASAAASAAGPAGRSGGAQP